MAIVLKPVRGPSKGVVAFTHKERHLLDMQAPVLGPELRRLRERYFVLMHWGRHAQDIPSFPAVDAHICRESAVTFRDSAVRRIPFNSALFTPDDFRPQQLTKHWDVISVTRALKGKRTSELLTCLRQVMDKRPETTALVVCSGPKELRARNYENDLYERYLSMFSEAERDRFTFLYTRSDIAFLLPRRDIAFFYNSSRVFTLFSDLEGESRVIKEALMCGLPVLLKRHLLGGGLDFVNEHNSRLFSSAADGADRLVDMLERPQDFHVDASVIADQIGEKANIPRFVQAVRALFDEAGIPFEGDLDTHDLSRKLPAHVKLLPVDMCSPATDDLRSGEAMLRYVRAVTDELSFAAVDVTPRERLLMHVFDQATTARKYLDAARRRLRLT